MKPFVFFIFFSVFSLTTIGQNLTDLDQYPLSSKQDFINAEKKVIECANYLFLNPVKKDDLNRLTAAQFILKWMEGTDYTFNIDSSAVELTDGNDSLFAMYLAGMSKLVIENPDKKFTDEALHAEVTILLIDYCKVASNNCKPTKKMKKIMKE